jgi:hypothetical protein
MAISLAEKSFSQDNMGLKNLAASSGNALPEIFNSPFVLRETKGSESVPWMNRSFMGYIRYANQLLKSIYEYT